MVGADFRELERFGDACALIEPGGREVTYQALAKICRDQLASLPRERQLILLEMRNDVASVAAYLACLGGGHCPILVGEDDGSGHGRIRNAFSPNLLWGERGFSTLTDEPAPALHPDLLLLLPTSGSTGSPKLVRLSRDNIEANADSICEYLRITPADRAITSLPLHYSFGLSVLNSHLRRGASLVLTDLSVTNPEFWSLVRAHGVTSFAGVPYSYELLERIGFRDDPPPSLTCMTQAGGKLAPDLVKTYAEFGATAGVRFFTMYGQTEASPRMAYLPPELAAENSDCVGVAIPGGSFHLIDDEGREIARPNVAGELVYRGPNVMMGYAFDRADLAKGAEFEELRTGDLGLRTDRELYKIVGRASRFVKIAGLRIGLDDVEDLLAEAGYGGRASGSDGLVVVCVTGEADAQAAREYVARRCGLPVSVVSAFHRPEAPRLASGKVDYATILRTGLQLAEEEATRAVAEDGVVAAIYGRALGVPAPKSTASFASLGGDSLSYVNISMGLERVLGHLPAGWEAMSIASLEATRPTEPAAPSRTVTVGSELLARLGALSLVLIGHAAPAETLWFRGGSNVLFALAGYSVARFQRASLLEGRPGPAIGGMLYRVIFPYLTLAAVMLPNSEADWSFGWPLLISVFTVKFRGPLFAFWFIESIFHALLIISALFLIPPVRAFAKARPFSSALALIAAATAFKYALVPIAHDGHYGFHITVDALLYVYALGWAASVASTRMQKLAVAGLAAVLSCLDYGIETPRGAWLTLALLFIMFAPTVRLPAVVGKFVQTLAGVSYFIYLTHVLVVHVVVHMLHWTDPWLTIPLVLTASALVGWAYAQAWNVTTIWGIERALKITQRWRAKPIFSRRG